MSTNKKKKLLLVFFIFLCCCLSTGYVTIMNKAIVNAKVKVKAPIWNVKFVDVETTNVIGSAANYERTSLTDSYISIFPSFEKPGDSISYRIKISNNGNLKAKIHNIGVYSSIIDVINFEYDDIHIGDVLNPGESSYFNIKFTYSPKKPVLKEKNEKILFVIDWKQAD